MAATNVLGAASGVVQGWWGLAWVLWFIGIATWPILLYITLVAVVLGGSKPGLEAGINGTWFLLTVSTESIAVLGALLLRRGDSDVLAFTCLALFCLGLVLYLIVMTMVFLRWTFVSLEPTEADPPSWIAAGAVAIIVLAGSNLLLAQDAAPRIARVAPAIEVVVVLAWATATFWFPLMVAIGVWRHVIRRVPLRYHPSYWALVFPLGMYGVATSRMIDATDVDRPRLAASPGVRHRLDRLDPGLRRAGRHLRRAPGGAARWRRRESRDPPGTRSLDVSRAESTSPLTADGAFAIVPGAVCCRIKEQAWDDSTTRWR